MIVDAFLNAVRNVIYGDSITMPSHIAVGTGTTAANANDTALETEIQPDGANRSAIDSKTKPENKAFQFQMFIGTGDGNGHILTEFGAINAASGGTLMNRIVHTQINKDSSFELKYLIKGTISEVS